MDLEDVFQAHERAVYGYFLRVIGDPHDAEELTQETFVRACGASLRYRGDAPVANWLFGIARRVLLEASRRGLFERRTDVAEIDPAAPQPDVDQRIDLERAFARLRRSDRETLMLVDVLGFGPSEAAALVDIDAQAFRARLHRARARLRQQLEAPSR